MPNPSTSLPNGEPVHARLTSMLDQNVSLDLRLTSILASGLVGTLDGTAIERAPAGPFWAEFKLPGEDRLFEYVVRLKHCARERVAGQAAVGWAFCDADEPPTDRGGIARMRRLVGRRVRLSTRIPHTAEGKPC